MVIYGLNMFQSQICATDMCDYGGSDFEKKGKKRKNTGKTKPTKKSYLASSNVKETVCVNCSIKLDNVPVTFPPRHINN